MAQQQVIQGQTITSGGIFWQGYRAAIPLMFGVAPFGLVFGALAVTGGMSLIQALGMSILVLAGSSQFVAAELVGDNTPALIIIFTTFIINLRHFLYSASLSGFYKGLSQQWKMLIGYLMVDEVYAIALLRQREGDLSAEEHRWFFVGAAFNLVTVWWGTTILGALVGDVLDASTRDALGFTLPLIFTSIVVPTLINRPTILAAVVASIAGVILAPMPNKLGLLIAAGIGIMAGVIAEQWQASQSKEKSE